MPIFEDHIRDQIELNFTSWSSVPRHSLKDRFSSIHNRECACGIVGSGRVSFDQAGRLNSSRIREAQ